MIKFTLLYELADTGKTTELGDLEMDIEEDCCAFDMVASAAGSLEELFDRDRLGNLGDGQVTDQGQRQSLVVPLPPSDLFHDTVHEAFHD